MTFSTSVKCSFLALGKPLQCQVMREHLSSAPIVTIKLARRLLGKEGEQLSDDEIITLIEKLEQIAGAFIYEKVHNTSH